MNTSKFITEFFKLSKHMYSRLNSQLDFLQRRFTRL